MYESDEQRSPAGCIGGQNGAVISGRALKGGLPVHELRLLAGHVSITTTQRYMNARANSLAESMQKATWSGGPVAR